MCRPEHYVLLFRALANVIQIRPDLHLVAREFKFSFQTTLSYYLASSTIYEPVCPYLCKSPLEASHHSPALFQSSLLSTFFHITVSSWIYRFRYMDRFARTAEEHMELSVGGL